jgi:N-acetylmuramoyl-L-alanine amidase
MNDFLQKYIVTPSYLTKPSKRRSGLAMTPGVRFIVAHDTGNPPSTARANVRYYENSRNEQSASAHLFVDDKEILECIPALTIPPEKAWHVVYGAPTDNALFGHDANDAAVGVEYCYGGAIDADEAYRKYFWTLACLCARFDLSPDRQIVGHFVLDPKRRTDPMTGLAQSRRTYDQLLRDTALELAECTGKPAPPSAVVQAEKPVTVITTVKLNIRKEKPNTRAAVVQVVPAGTELSYLGWTDDGEPVNGNPRWYADANGNYFWGGGVRPKIP